MCECLTVPLNPCCCPAAAKVVGAENCGAPYLTMTSEDFSLFLQKRPGCFFFVGCNPGDDRPHHKPNFTFRWVARPLLLCCEVARRRLLPHAVCT